MLCPTASMTPSYFYRKQKESRLNQQNFLAVQILTYDLHIILCDRSNLFLGFFLTYNHGQKSLGQSERNFRSMRFTSSVAKSSAVFYKSMSRPPSPPNTMLKDQRNFALTVSTLWGGGRGTTVPRLLSMIVVHF